MAWPETERLGEGLSVRQKTLTYVRRLGQGESNAGPKEFLMSNSQFLESLLCSPVTPPSVVCTGAPGSVIGS